MSKLKKFRQAISAIVRQPSLLNVIIDENTQRAQQFYKKYPKQQPLPQISLVDVLKANSVDLFFLDGASLPTDIALLKSLAQGKQSYFEIGTWRGESVWNIAKVIDDCTTLNLSKNEINRLGLDPAYADLHGVLSKRNPKIKHLEANSKTFDFAGLNKKYDLIFIDGDHSYEMVKNDSEKIFQHLIHDDSMIVWHDYGYNPEKVRYEVFQAILDGTPQEFHKNLYHVSNTMCAVFSRQNFKTKPFKNFNNQPFIFELNIQPSFLE